MPKVTIDVDPLLFESAVKFKDEGKFQTQRELFLFLMKKGYYAYLKDGDVETEVVEKKLISKDELERLLKESYADEEEGFLNLVASFIMFRYKEGEIDFIRKSSGAPGEVIDMLLDGWRLNFRLKVIYLYYILTEDKIKLLNLYFLYDNDNRHPLFSVLKALDDVLLTPEEEVRVKYLLMNYENWSQEGFHV
jgi:hypothetical protein